MNRLFFPGLYAFVSLHFFAAVSPGFAAAPHPHFHTVKLLLSPTDELNSKGPGGMDSLQIWLLREGYSLSILGSAPFQDKGWYAADNSVELHLFTFNQIRNGRYTVYLSLHGTFLAGGPMFPVASIEVAENRQIALDLPPIFQANVHVILPQIPAYPAIWLLDVAGADTAHRHYHSQIALHLEGTALTGVWDGLLVPGQYTLTLDEHRGGFESGRRRTLKWGPLRITPQNVIDGTITMDLRNTKFSEERNWEKLPK